MCEEKRNWDLGRMLTSIRRYVFDLHAKIPYHSMPESERKEIWDDGLHFTSKGYERMGVMVAERLVEILEKEEKSGEGGS